MSIKDCSNEVSLRSACVVRVFWKDPDTVEWFVANKFAPIDEQLWEGAMTDLASGSRDNVSLYLNKFQVAALPSKCSRHNAPAR